MKPHMLHRARSRSADRARYNLTRAGGQLLQLGGFPVALASAAFVLVCNIAIAGMSGWQEAQQAVLDPQPRERRS